MVVYARDSFVGSVTLATGMAFSQRPIGSSSSSWLYFFTLRCLSGFCGIARNSLRYFTRL